MAYGALRFLYANMLNDATLTASAWATGRVSGVSKDGTGTASLTVGGSYAGAYDLSYTFEITSIAGGTEVGQSTFSWRNNRTSGAWEETGVLTRTSPAYALSADGLGTSLTVSNTGGVGADFALNDSWQWEARATYGPYNVLDRNRMTTWRTTTTTGTLVIDLGSAKTPQTIVIQDHNFTSLATVTLQGNSSDSWGSPAFSYTFSTIEDALVYYLSGTNTYRYWRVALSDGTNPDGYLEMSNIFLGSYLQLDKINAEWGSSEINGAVLQSNTSEAAVMRRYYYAGQNKLTLNMGNVVKNADVTNILAIQTALINTTTKRISPLWVHLFSDQNETLRLMEWENIGTWNRTFFVYLLNSGITFDFSEVVKI